VLSAEEGVRIESEDVECDAPVEVVSGASARDGCEEGGQEPFDVAAEEKSWRWWWLLGVVVEEWKGDGAARGETCGTAADLLLFCCYIGTYL